MSKAFVFEIKTPNIMSIEIVNGRVFIEGKETVNPELIGYAVLDAAEANQNLTLHPISDKSLLSIIKNQVELSALNTFLEREYPAILESKVCNYWDQRPFDVNWPSSDMLFNLIMMIKNDQLVFKDLNNECNSFPTLTHANEALDSVSKNIKDYRCPDGNGIIGSYPNQRS